MSRMAECNTFVHYSTSNVLAMLEDEEEIDLEVDEPICEGSDNNLEPEEVDDDNRYSNKSDQCVPDSSTPNSSTQ